MKMLQEYWASTVIFIGIFSQCIATALYIPSSCFLLFFLSPFLSLPSR